MRVQLAVMFVSLLFGFESTSLNTQGMRVQNALTGKIAYAALSEDKSNLDIYVISADGTGKTQLTDSPGNDYDMDWSPDGTQIIFRSDREGYDALYLMNAYGSDQHIFVENADEQKRSPAWSPDGEWIAFAAYVPDTATAQNIHIVRADGTERRLLTEFREPNFAEYPDWSPDGSHLVFLAATPSIKQVFLINVDGTGQVQLTDGYFDNDYPAWSPDGKQIVFKSERDGDREIYIMNADGSEQVNLTNSPDTEDTYPAWSPDGLHIIYFSDNPTESGLFLMNADGTNQHWLADGMMPAWIASD